MVADRQQCPERRLGQFLWLRDLVHEFRYAREEAGGAITPAAAGIAEEGIALFRQHFLDVNDLMAGDALAFQTVLLEALGRGIEVNVTCQARKPELTGTAEAGASLSGRVESSDDLLRLLAPRLAEWGQRWDGPYV